MRNWLVEVDAPEPQVKMRNGRPASASGPDVKLLLEDLQERVFEYTGKESTMLTASHVLVVPLTDEQAEEIRSWSGVSRVILSQLLA